MHTCHVCVCDHCVLAIRKCAHEQFQGDLTMACILDVRVLRTTPETSLTKEDLEKNIEIILTETKTLKFFDLPTVIYSVESEEAEKIVYV